MTDILTAQLPLIASLQSALASSSALVAFWKAVTILGNEEFFLLLIPIVYWCISSRRGLELGVLIIGGDALNVLLKLFFSMPRPYWIGHSVHALTTDASFGLPSSHAQNAVAVWFFLAYLASKKHGRVLPYSVATLVILLVSLSRVVLGVHFPIDVVAGWVLGFCLLAAYFRFAQHFSTSWKYMSKAEKIRFITIGYFLFLFLSAVCILRARNTDPFAIAPVKLSSSSEEDNLRWLTFARATATGIQALSARAGALSGLILGVALILRGTRFDISGTMAQKAARFLIGFIGILLIWRGLAAVFPKGDDAMALAFRFLRYALLTLWVVYLAPLVFSRLTFGGPKPPRKLEKGISPLACVD